MSRRSFLLAVAITLLVLGGSTLTLFALIRHEPRHYQAAAVEAGPTRTQRSQEFSHVCCDLITAINNEREWYAQFTDEQINSYLEEGFVRDGWATRILPKGISDPRVVIEPDRIRLAFRYGTGRWSAVISIDLDVYLPREEPNVVALKLLGFHAGALPITAQSLLDGFAEAAQENGMELKWYRENGRPVAIVRFQADQPEPTLHLLPIKLDKGSLTIRGRSSEATRVSLLWPLFGNALKVVPTDRP